MTHRARIALAHDWLCGYRGGEAVLDRIARLVLEHFEPAGLYVMTDDRKPLTPAIDYIRKPFHPSIARVMSAAGAPALEVPPAQATAILR